MNNSQFQDMVTVSLALFKDIASNFPHGVVEDRDILRFTHMCENRGDGFLTIDLPHLNDVLLAGLESGRATFKGPLMGPSKSGVPKFLQGLWSRIFDNQGVLLNDPCVDAIFFLRQLSLMWKSLFEVCPEDSVKRAIEGYQEDDNSIRASTLNWEGDTLSGDFRSIGFGDVLSGRECNTHSAIPSRADSLHSSDIGANPNDDRFDCLAALCDSFAEGLEQSLRSSYKAWRFPTSRRESVGGFRHGPGSVSNQLFKGDKYLFESWPKRLQKWFPYELVVGGYSTPRLLLSDELGHSKLIAVPKTRTKPRLICSEPNEFMWVQQHIWNQIRSYLKPWSAFVDFGDQGGSQILAKAGSMDKSLSTIDLRSASDLLSLYVLERVFRKSPTFLRMFHACRAPTILIDGEVHTKNKALSQGTALTFPVQTIVFLLISLASCGVDNWNSKKHWKLKGKVRVFGDDIIVPTRAFEEVTRLLSDLGLCVNSAKSFTKGHFREACGGDFYKGYDVAPLRFKSCDTRSPVGLVALVDNANNSFKKGLFHVSKQLEAITGRLLPVRSAPGPMVLYSFSGDCDHPRLKRRWNHDLQRNEVQAYITSGVQSGSEPHSFSLLLPSLRRMERTWFEAMFPLKPTRRVVVESSRTKVRRGWVQAAT